MLFFLNIVLIKKIILHRDIFFFNFSFTINLTLRTMTLFHRNLTCVYMQAPFFTMIVQALGGPE